MQETLVFSWAIAKLLTEVKNTHSTNLIITQSKCCVKRPARVMYEKSGNLLCEKLQFVESNRFYHIKLSNDIEYSNKNTLGRFGRSKKGNNKWINFPLLIEHYIELKTAHTPHHYNPCAFHSQAWYSSHQ